MTDVNTATAPFAKARSSLLSLDEVPHKRHVPPPVLSTFNPLVPKPGTPAFATRKDQFAVDAAADLKRTEEARRQQKQVDLGFNFTHLCLCPKSAQTPTSCEKLQAYMNDRRQQHRAAEYEGECEEDRRFKRERERILNLQATDAGRSNRSGDHFDILTLAYQPSQGGRQLKSMVQFCRLLCCPMPGPGISRCMLTVLALLFASPHVTLSMSLSDDWLHMCIFQLIIADTDLAAGNNICGGRFYLC